jgi:hypothetical protein
MQTNSLNSKKKYQKILKLYQNQQLKLIGRNGGTWDHQEFSLSAQLSLLQFGNKSKVPNPLL